MLTDIQMSLISHSWRNCTKGGPQGVGAVIFRRIFTKHPEIRGLFSFGNVPSSDLQYNKAFHQHANIFVEVIDGAINNVRHLDKFVPRLYEIGRKHVKLAARGFKIEFWDLFAEALTESARDWNRSTRNLRETNRAWTILMAFIIDQMRFAFRQELRRHQKLQLSDSVIQKRHVDDNKSKSALRSGSVDMSGESSAGPLWRQSMEELPNLEQSRGASFHSARDSGRIRRRLPSTPPVDITRNSYNRN